MRISKLFRASIAAAGVAVLFTACAEAPSSPMMETSAEAALSRSAARQREDSGVARFTLNPQQGLWVKLGGHDITVPANVICDPVKSAYGPEHWDTPCELATRPIPMVAHWYVKHGLAHIQFIPDLRFAPSADPAKHAKLTMRLAQGDVNAFTNILWWNRQSNEWVDEGATDPSLTPWFENGNRIARRLKHFSGYVIGTFCGDACEPPPSDM